MVAAINSVRYDALPIFETKNSTIYIRSRIDIFSNLFCVGIDADEKEGHVLIVSEQSRHFKYSVQCSCGHFEFFIFFFVSSFL